MTNVKAGKEKITLFWAVNIPVFISFLKSLLQHQLIQDSVGYAKVI